MSNSKFSTAVQIAAILFIFLIAVLAKAILIPLLVAIFISIVCMQPIIFLADRKVPYNLAVVVVLITVSVVLIVLGTIVASSFTLFLADIPKYQDNLLVLIDKFFGQLAGVGIQLDESKLQEAVNTQNILATASSFFSNLGRLISDSFIVILLAVFLILEAPTFVDKTTVIERHFGSSIQHIDRIGRVVRHYLSIKTFISFLTGALVWLSLLIIGVDYPILWGIIAFLLNYIPNIGSIIAAVPTMFLALIQLGLGAMIWTGLAYLIINLFMGNIIEPRVLGKGLGLSTLIVLLSLIFWGFIFGPMGMLLSVPLTMTIKIMLENSEKTNWIAVLLGTGEQASRHVKKND